VGKRWIALIALANLGLYLGYFAPLGVLLPNQVQAIAGPAGKVVAFGWVIGAGAAVALISNPVAGALSDRTTARFGRRHPWTGLRPAQLRSAGTGPGDRGSAGQSARRISGSVSVRRRHHRAWLDVRTQDPLRAVTLSGPPTWYQLENQWAGAGLVFW
jgi:hypothetical protein